MLPPIQGKLARFPKLGLASSIALLVAAGAAPSCVVAIALIWNQAWTPVIQAAATLAVLAPWCLALARIHQSITFPLRTLTNLLSALREGDYSMRSARANQSDALGAVMSEVNGLGDILSHQTRQTAEASALLQTVLQEIEVAVFAFDRAERLRLVNRAGARLIDTPEQDLVNAPASRLDVADLLHIQTPGTVARRFPGSVGGRWAVRASNFREGGQPHRLLVISDVSAALRAEEREAWSRLIRVLGHELNNSLGPMQSIAKTLLLSTPKLYSGTDPEALVDVERGLWLIQDRAEALSRFTAAYAKLAQLPPPDRHGEDLRSLVTQVAALFDPDLLQVMPGAPVTVWLDRAQIEQVLINLIRNALEAAENTGGVVTITWRTITPIFVELVVRDEGPGLASDANLFVPFFTTKSHGSGIGLVLSQQIVEAHHGSLQLINRADGKPGCEAVIRLPLRQAGAGDLKWFERGSVSAY